MLLHVPTFLMLLANNDCAFDRTGPSCNSNRASDKMQGAFLLDSVKISRIVLFVLS